MAVMLPRRYSHTSMAGVGVACLLGGADAARVAQLMQRRLEYLPEAVANSTGYKVLPGVPERLRQLSRDGHLLGLITGNYDGAAYIKLQRGGLGRWFTFCAYELPLESWTHPL
jgi:phosphoglycolate phosphatase-like HAD superfamily hydrolase